MYSRAQQLIHLLLFLSILMLSSIAEQGYAASGEQHLYLPILQIPVGVHLEYMGQYRTRPGSQYANGVIVNDTIAPLYNITIETLFLDQGNQVTATTTTAFPATLPGQRNMFMSEPIGGVNETRFITARVTHVERESARRYGAATIVKAIACPGHTEYGPRCVELRNDSAETLHSIKLLTALSTAEYGVNSFEMFVMIVDDPLAPHATRKVQVSKPYDWQNRSWPEGTWFEAQGELGP